MSARPSLRDALLEFDFEEPGSGERAKSIDPFAGDRESRRKGPKKPPSIRDADFARARVAAREMAKSGDWEGALPRHQVALFAELHARVYGVEPLDLGPTQRGRASGMVGQMLRRHFGWSAGEPSRQAEAHRKMSAFLEWAWRREERTEKWRRENGRDGRRLGWALCFGGSLLADYAVEKSRAASVPRR